MRAERSSSRGVRPVPAIDILDRLARSLDASDEVTSTGKSGVRDAAVAVIFRIARDDALELLMIERARYAGDPWSGHIAFPGGRSEPADVSLLATALRETREEIGVDLAADGRILGALTRLLPMTPRLPPIAIAPFVAVLARDVPLALSEEVAGAFWVPLSTLQRADGSCDVEITVGGTLRTVHAFVHGRYTIWGLTERIICDLLARIGT
jgi:8-oxo-dGTP pyrophosphatase MutT (NUDIX family)